MIRSATSEARRGRAGPEPDGRRGRHRAANRLSADDGRLLEEALADWHRRRATIFCAVCSAIFAISAVLGVRGLLGGHATLSALLDVAVDGTLGAGFVLVGLMFHRARWSRRAVVRAFGWLIMTVGALAIFAGLVVVTFDTEASPEAMVGSQQLVTAAGTALFAIFLLHAIASLFVALPPWSALWPLLPLWALYAGAVLLLDGPLWLRATLAASFPIAGLPGWLWSVWRHERFVDRFQLELLGDRWSEIRRELGEARRVHESLFPAPMRDGAVLLDYVYEPMREVGGDFLFARRGPDGRLIAVIIDVTGHGIASALAVTRLASELVRVCGSPDATADAAIAQLNEFMVLSMSGLGVYATAVAVVVQPDGSTSVCNAGHPRLLLVAPDGARRWIDSTCPMLGVLESASFEPRIERLGLRRGDRLVACTDGLLEAVDGAGRFFGEEGIDAFISAEGGADAPVPERLLEAMQRFRGGPARDDTLIVQIGLGPT